MASAVGKAVPGLLGPDGADASGVAHPGLPWAGCTVLAADAGTLRAPRAKAATKDEGYCAVSLGAPQKDRPARRRAESAPLTR
ncbi:DUF2000 family protein [Streptomyces scopuliridis]|uniref:DUF2000 family protein n=1 Tax=Streptomyces scopuliridis TaxID=452529 RepID=UPI00368ABA87